MSRTVEAVQETREAQGGQQTQGTAPQPSGQGAAARRASEGLAADRSGQAPETSPTSAEDGYVLGRQDDEGPSGGGPVDFSAWGWGAQEPGAEGSGRQEAAPKEPQPAQRQDGTTPRQGFGRVQEPGGSGADQPPAESKLEPADDAPPEQGTGKLEEADPRFTDTVRNNFDSWDKDRDGRLSDGEVDKAIMDSKNKGADAAALATLKEKRDDLEEVANDELGDENDGVSRKDLEELDKHKDDKKLREGSEADFDYRRAKISGQSRELFANGNPDPKALKQGSTGNCYFVAALAGLAERDPERLKQMVKDNGDGTYTVKLGGGKEQKVQAPTDAEVAMYGSAGQDGMWQSVMEKAYAQRENNGEFFPEDDPHDSTGDGGFLGTGVEDVTGHSSDRDELPLTSENEIREKMKKAEKDNAVVTAGIRKGITGDEREGMPMGHAYTVLDYDEATDTVTIRNPWGQGEWNGAKDGNDDGVFKMSVKDFKDKFSYVAYEER